jgi:ATP-dependent RNA helicase RhlE
MDQGHLRLGRVEVLVLDEADHMLDLGFLPDVKKIIAACPKRRQTLLFSATMPPPIAALAARILTTPEKVFVTPAASTVEEVEQRVHFVARAQKSELLARLLRDPLVERVLVFTRTKRGADRVARRLGQDGIAAAAIHGNRSQNARERTLLAFRRGKTRVLVATDIAARGIDVDGITHVINFDVPNVPESYVHRIGRTARAGAKGVAVTLCDAEERAYLRDIERLTGRKLRVMEGEFEPERPERTVRSNDKRTHGRGRPARAGRSAGPDRHTEPRRRSAPSRVRELSTESPRSGARFAFGTGLDR